MSLFLIDAACGIAASIVSFSIWVLLSRAVGDDSTIGQTVPQLLADKWFWFPMSLAIWHASSWLVDLYDAAIAGIGGVLAQRTVVAALMTTCVFMTAYFFAPKYIPRVYFLAFVATVSSLTIAARLVHQKWSDAAGSTHRMLLVGDLGAATELRMLLNRVRRLKLELVGWTSEQELAGLQFDYGRDGLYRYAMAEGVNEIVVASSGESQFDDAYRALVECQANGIRVSSMAEVYRKLSRQIPIQFVDSKWILTAMQDRLLFTRFQLGLKRLTDIVGALVAAPFILAVTPLVALAIKLDSRGSVFYCQERVGRAGKRFRIVKFRTMSSDAEKDGKAVWASDNDPRITRVGAILRKTRIDELPQFLNVLWGEMSLVGPRPEREAIEMMLDNELPHYFIRRLVKPGITGWAQVHYKYGNTVDDSRRKLQYDAYYVRHWSVLLDFYTMFRTLGVMIGSKGQ